MDARKPSSRKNSSEAMVRAVGPASSGARVPDNSTALLGVRAASRIQQDGAVNTGEPRRKRGRPRKYGSDITALPLHPKSSVLPSWYSNPSSARRRSRRPKPLKKQQAEAPGSIETPFTPRVIIVGTGEDVASKIMALSREGSRTLCVLSANGAISRVTLYPARSREPVIHEGRFTIVSLSGSFTPAENGGMRGRSGGLSVLLATPEGLLFGGDVGVLVAATPVQLVMGSFISPSLTRLVAPMTVSASGPSSEETLSDPVHGNPQRALMDHHVAGRRGTNFHTNPAYAFLGGCATDV